MQWLRGAGKASKETALEMVRVKSMSLEDLMISIELSETQEEAAAMLHRDVASLSMVCAAVGGLF